MSCLLIGIPDSFTVINQTAIVCSNSPLIRSFWRSVCLASVWCSAHERISSFSRDWMTNLMARHRTLIDLGLTSNDPPSRICSVVRSCSPWIRCWCSCVSRIKSLCLPCAVSKWLASWNSYWSICALSNCLVCSPMLMIYHWASYCLYVVSVSSIRAVKHVNVWARIWMRK